MVPSVAEIDAGRMQWSRSLGLPPSPLSFQDLFSLDDEFLAFVPQPVRAVLLLFPSRGALAAARKEEEEKGEGNYEGKVWYIKQTVCVMAFPEDRFIFRIGS